ncbi:MAG: hypothetical protein BWY12_02166 [candidate division BRC1 bacterium ADurb.Bin183]|nr:MAG: hypothetical protein BWY12_02166 [candidate division BRC1 bacterium ADurb.Bin183]
MHRLICLAGLIVLMAVMTAAADMKPLEGGDLIVVERSLEAASEQEGREQAAREAIQSCAGRVYFSDMSVMARPLLEKYVDTYYKNFIYSVVVDSKKQTGDKFQLSLKVFVNYSKLLADLEEKKFLFRPAVRPLFAAFLKEIVDEQPSAGKDGWDAIRSAWRDLTEQRPTESEIADPPANVDVSESPALLAEAIRAVQKNGAEVIITGESSTLREKREELYYDTYVFYRTTVNLKLYRADTGELLQEATATSLAGSVRQNQAINLSTVSAVKKAVFQLADYYHSNWDKMVRNKGDYMFLFSGVTDEKLDLIQKKLIALNNASQVFVKSKYADVAVVTLVFKGNRERLLEVIQSSSYPRMHILKDEENRLEIQIKN